jgi:hypothetical protein
MGQTPKKPLHDTWLLWRLGRGKLQKATPGEMPESVFRVSEKTLTKLKVKFFRKF